MKQKLLLALLCLSILCASIVAYLVMGYPGVWDDVPLGATREQVHELCGMPDSASWQCKGDFWVVGNPIGRWEFMAGNNGNKVGSTRINLFIGFDRPTILTLKDDGAWDFHF